MESSEQGRGMATLAAVTSVNWRGQMWKLVLKVRVWLLVPGS